ncbi:MAG TPA: ABC transporter permease [Candidatus Limnocylindrales bacterium]|nr:ABC transporter permease [Candidatus Limnocylindrales bacterium]
MNAALHRAGRLAIVLLIVTAFSSLMVDLLPGDPALAILGPEATPEQIAALRHDLELDRPLPVRYLAWLGSAATGDLGSSVRTGQDVGAAIAQRLPVSLELLLLSQILALAIAVLAAILAAAKPDGVFDRVVTTLSSVVLGLPAFVLGLVLILLLSVQLGLLPTIGFTPLSEGVGQNLRSMALPVLTVALGETVVYIRVLRADLLATLSESFIDVARAKGLSERRVMLGHAIRPSSLALVTLVGLNAGRLVGSAVIIESMFALPGVGRLLVDAIADRDYTVVQGAVALIAVSYVLLNVAVDALYGVIDPRVRHGHTR